MEGLEEALRDMKISKKIALKLKVLGVEEKREMEYRWLYYADIKQIRMW